MEKELSELKKQKESEDIDKEKYENEKISAEFLICENKVDMAQAESEAFDIAINEKNMEINNCTKNNEYLTEKRKELKIVNKIGVILLEIDKITKINENNIKTMKELKNENEHYLNEKKIIKKYQNEIYFFIYFELLILILIVVIAVIFYRIKRENKNSYINYSYNNNFIPISKQENDY